MKPQPHGTPAPTSGYRALVVSQLREAGFTLEEACRLSDAMPLSDACWLNERLFGGVR